MGARSNFEGGPSALAAGLTGRTPRYGYHLDAHRAGTRHFDARPPAARPRRLGRARRHRRPGHQQLLGGAGRHRPRGGAQLRRAQALRRGAGELRLGGPVPHAGRHARGARRWPRPSRGRAVPPAHPRSAAADFDAFYATYAAPGDKVDVVVFAAPQLSLLEMQQVADLLDGRHVHAATSLIVTTSPEIKFAADRMGLTRAHRGRRRHRRGGRVLLPELCARDGGGQRLAAPAHQLGQARQHHRRLRLQADARQHGALHRQRRRRDGSC